MVHHNQRGQILAEALVILLTLTLIFFVLLANLQQIRERNKKYGISRETSTENAHPRFKK